MKKFCLAIALCMALAALAGCAEREVPMRQLRYVSENYTVSSEDHTVSYTDGAGKEIELYGKLYVPQADEKYPAVILSHGYNNTWEGFRAECDRFSKRGYICYAFDFCGASEAGKSTGRNRREYTPYTMKEDLKAVIADIKQMGNVDPTQIFLFGGSQGGFVTMLTAADDDLKDTIAGVATYFPALNIPDDWRDKPIEDSSPAEMGYLIGAEYIRSIRELDVFEVIGNYGGDVCIVWGDSDIIVHRTYIERAIETFGEERTEYTEIAGAGHGFGGAAQTKAIGAVLDFLEARTYVCE